MFPFHKPDDADGLRERNRAAVAKHYGGLPPDVRKAVYRARKYLERAGLSQSQLLDDSTLSRVATLLDGPRTTRDDAQEMRYKELLACRSNVGRGNDNEARDRALALKAVSSMGTSIFDERVRLYCDQILFIVGESMGAPNPAAKLQAKADALLRGWAIQRDYLNVAITLIERAHTYRLTGMFFFDRHFDREYRKAARAISAAMDLLEGLCRDRNPALVNWLKHEASFHRFKIAFETGDESRVEQEIARLRQIGDELGNTPRVQTDNLQAEISYAIYLRDFNKAEGLLKDGYARWEALSPRSPYTWFNLKYLEIALLFGRKHKWAMAVLDEYLWRWEQVPQMFYLARLKLLRIENFPRTVRSPTVFTSRASLFYLEDQIARRD